MRYTIEPRDFDTHATKVTKNISIKCSQKTVLIVLKHLLQIQWKLLQKKTIEKTAEATGDVIGNKIADKITSISKSPQNFSKEFHSKNRWEWNRNTKV